MTGSEHEEQVALFEWAAWNKRKYPGLELMFAIPNGGQRHVVVAKKLKDEGVKAGVPDIFLPVKKRTGTIVVPEEIKDGHYFVPSMNDTWVHRPGGFVGDKNAWVLYGLFIEMKVGKNKLTQNQEDWCEKLQDAGYLVAVCYGADEAIALLEWYLSGS